MAVAFALVIGGLASMTLATKPERCRTALGAAAALAGIPGFGIVHAALIPTSGRLALVGAAVAAIGAGAGFRAALRSFASANPEALDARARPAVWTALFLTIVALLTRIGSTVGHLHLVLPQLSLVGAAAAVCLAGVATGAFFAQARWTRRLYRNEASPLSVGPLPRDVDLEAVPPLSEGENDAAICADPTRHGPYRERAFALARVPSSDTLITRYARTTRIAAATCSASVLGLFVWPHASAAHSAEIASVPTVLPRPACFQGAGWPTVRFVALEPLKLVDIERVADRYRRAGLRDVRVEKPLQLEERFVDRRRHQLDAERIAEAAAREHPLTKPLPWWQQDVVIVLTDRDMFVPATLWPYALATAHADVVVISLARLDPAFPLVATETYEPEPPACAATLHERAYKMITHRIAMSCGAGRYYFDGLSHLDGAREDLEILGSGSE
jgi:hypothetical protein